MAVFHPKSMALATFMALSVSARTLLAQSPATQPANQPPASRPTAGTTSPPASRAPQAPSDANQKTKLLASPAWQQINSEYQKWLASQAIYTPADVKQINAKLAAEIQTMSASDLQEYIDDWQTKLKVLNGKDFQEAQQWLGYYLQPCTDGYRAKTLKQLGLTNVTQMSAAELENAILRIRADRLSMKASQAAFEQSRQQQVQMVQQAQSATQQALQQSDSGGNYRSAGGFNTFQSPYSPQKFNPPPNPHMQFYMDSWGRIGYVLPW